MAVIVLFAVPCFQKSSHRHRLKYYSYVLTHFRKPATVAKHTELNESDASVESENEGATSDNPSDNNTSSVSKGVNYVLVGLDQDIVDAE